jgi:hypothetical protein
MPTDMGKLEQDGFLDSSHAPNRGKNSDRSAGNSRKNSKRGPAKDAGKEVETKLTSLDVLLSILQSDLGEIRDFGGVVQFFSYSDGLMIQLPNVAICHSHKMMHSGTICPMC